MELLSPAGDFESFITAVKNGADAVYIGGPSFSARKNAKNFTEEEIKKAVDYAHLRGVKVYVALNILIKQEELNAAVLYAKRLIEMGVDGIIVQDLGMLKCIRKLSDEVKINASTQMTICSSDGVNLLKELGADRVVLARELSQKEISAIREKTDVELETFVHGAICISYSGQCLMSSVIGGRSGNRGACAQPCRLKFTLLKDGVPVTSAAPLLCTKDLCLAEDMKTIKEISDSAKIEGRMKSPEYTGIVTQVYKKALLGKATKDEISEMLSVFSRGGSSRGYFGGRMFSEMMDKSGKEKVTAAKETVTEIKETNLEKRRPLSLKLTATVGEPISLSAESGGFSALSTGDVLEKAQNGIFDAGRAKAQLGKLGDTCFFAENIEIFEKGTPFVAVSVLNGLRREVCEKLEKEICASFRKKTNDLEIKKKERKRETSPALSVYVHTKEQYDAAKEMGIKEIYLAHEIFGAIDGENNVCAMPSVTKEGEKRNETDAARVLIQNLGQIKKCEKKTLLGGERLNITNTESLEVLKTLGFQRATLSTELNLKDIRRVIENTDFPVEIICYGRLPLMLIENCIIKSHYGCAKEGGTFSLSDRKGEVFPVLCENCKNVVLNSVPLYMADKLSDILELGAEYLRLHFTIETKEETKRVIKAYQEALEGNAPHGVFDKITRGHFYRGVE